jgi:hypothetical protein
MSSSMEKRETGSALMVIGWVMVLFALLVLFFNPAALKLGEIRFELIAAGLVLTGLLLSAVGGRIRSRHR